MNAQPPRDALSGSGTNTGGWFDGEATGAPWVGVIGGHPLLASGLIPIYQACEPRPTNACCVQKIESPRNHLITCPRHVIPCSFYCSGIDGGGGGRGKSRWCTLHNHGNLRQWAKFSARYMLCIREANSRYHNLRYRRRGGGRRARADSPARHFSAAALSGSTHSAMYHDSSLSPPPLSVSV